MGQSDAQRMPDAASIRFRVAFISDRATFTTVLLTIFVMI
jgi:hypothetical protein